MRSQNSIDWTRRLTRAGVVAVVYYVTGRLAVLLAIPPGIATAVWPPSGVALAAVLLWGYSVWPGIWLGSVLVNFGTLYDGGSVASAVRSVLVVGNIGLGSTLQAVLGAFLVQRWTGTRAPFDRAWDVFKFVGAEALSCSVAPSLGATGMCLAGFTNWSAFEYTWWTWWMGDLVGVLVVAPVLLVWSTPPQIRWDLRRSVEAAALVALMLVVSGAVFAIPFRFTIRQIPLTYMNVPLVLWAAFRFGRRGVVILVLAASILATLGTIQHTGPYATERANESLMLLQTFVGVLAVTGLVLAVTLSERRRAEEALQNAHDDLERRVLERTSDLTETNRLLRVAIDGRTREQKALTESEERFRSVVESANDAVVQADSRGNIIGWNPAAQTIFGYGPDEVIGHPLTKLMPDRYHEAHQHGLARFQTTGEAHVIGKTLELEGLRKDGSEFPIELSISHWRQGEELFYGALIRDITERRRTEKALRDSEERFRLIVEGVKDYAFFLLDTGGHVVSWNAGAERIKGYRAEEIIGQHFSRFFPEADRQQGKPERELQVVVAEGRIEDEGWRLRKDGSPFWANVVITAVRDKEGKLVGFSKLTRDLTRRKQAEEELKRSEQQLRSLAERLQEVREEERTRIARELHDELGQAMTGLKMDLARLEKHVSKPDAGGGAALRDKITGMTKLIDGTIHSVRRISTELRPGMLDDLGLRTAIEWQANEFQSRSGISCELKSLPDEVRLSRDAATAVFRIFQEALTNVARHAKASRVEVAMMKESGHWILEVSDNGRGISDAELADKASLGLLGMRERAAVLGGDVRVAGMEGGGTMVRVRIPAMEAETRANTDR